jgi:predicted DNA-binding transcriptional regulator YafY
MKRSSSSRRRLAVHITLGRAARLHHLVMLLAQAPRTRDEVLVALRIGLRTFYRELDLLKRSGVKIQQKNKAYALLTTAEQAEGRLPFPDPQLSFAEMAELARGPGEAAKRLAEILASVVEHPETDAKGPKGRRTKAAKVKGKDKDQGKPEG